MPKSLKKSCLDFCVQVLKESATELLFGGHETTASTATSLIMFLGLNPEVLDKLRHELSDKVMQHCEGVSVKSLCTSFQCNAFIMSIRKDREWTSGV